MAKIKYASGVTPLVNEHYGYTFQPGNYYQKMLSLQAGDRTRYPRQWTRMQNMKNALDAWRGLSSGEKADWENWALTYPQFAKNGVDYLTGYQTFIKRQYYQFLNYGSAASIISSPQYAVLPAITFDFKLSLDGGEFIISPTPSITDSNYITSVFLSRGNYESVQYPGSKPRYMGYFINSPSIIIEYGNLYNYFSVVDARNIAASGWHVPDIFGNGFNILRNYYGASVAGGKLKETGFVYWNSPNTGADNLSSFYGRGAGNRNYSTGAYGSFNISCNLWSSREYPVSPYNSAYTYRLVYNSANFGGYNVNKKTGASIRLLKDSTTLSPGESGTYIGNDGTIYPTICIGTQEWLAANLIETQYRNNDLIPVVSDSSSWVGLSTGAMCYYNNDINNAYSGSDLKLDVTELYKYNFGLLPTPGQFCILEYITFSVNSGQFIDKQSIVLEVE